MATPVRLNEITYQVARSGRHILAAKRLCHDVYLDAGYIDHAMPGGVMPNEHDADSVYLVALTGNDEVVGTVRMNIGHFKTVDAWKDHLHADRRDLIGTVIAGRAFEIEALAVRRDLSSLHISWGLYNAMLTCSLQMGLQHAVIGVDARVLRALEMQGWSIVRIGEPMMYYGSMTVPGIIPVNEQPRTLATGQATSTGLAAA